MTTIAIILAAGKGTRMVSDLPKVLFPLRGKTLIARAVSTATRAFERPPLQDGAPDYTAATVARRQAELAGYRARLEAFDVATWPIDQRVDLELVRAEMNGFDFDARVLQPWVRDPAFYATLWTEQSDTPSHEGPVPAGRRGEARRGAPPDPRLPRPGADESHRQRARSVDDRHRHDAPAGGRPGRPREAGGGERAGAARRRRRGTAGDRGTRRLARNPDAVEDRTLRNRQGELHLEPPPRASRADELGGGGRSLEARAR